MDSNCDPEGVQFPIPGNDDAMRAIALYCDLIGGAVLTGLQAEMVATGQDIGASEEVPMEPALVSETVLLEEPLVQDDTLIVESSKESQITKPNETEKES